MSTARVRWIQAKPTEYLIHYRRGKVIRQGMGLGTWRLPVLDHVTLVPCTAHSLGFAADQITRENQGVDIAGFAVWKVAKPDLTAQRFDFDDPEEPTKAIGVCLKDVVESAIRHRVANMTIEEVLRKRASIILELKRELDFITDQWGLAIDTIEIKRVSISSAEVFRNLQAGYREQLRLESETQRLGAEKDIALRRLSQQEELQAEEAGLKARAQEQEHDLRMKKARLDYEAQVSFMEGEEAMKRERFTQVLQTLEAEKDLLAAREAQRETLRTQETVAKQHDAAMAEYDASVIRVQTEAGNTRNGTLALIDALPEIVQKLKLGEVNITPDLAGALARVFNGRAAG